jgi:dTDP-4-amino-4,6-dideoxygalactose transaminase
MKIPLTKPYFDASEKELVCDVIESGWWTAGPQVTSFEKDIEAFIGAGDALATTSCTTSLHLALLINGIGPGDEVIIPSYTWIATANVVLMAGAIPVFADIDLRTLNVSVESIKGQITRKTKAIMCVHQFGNPVNLKAIGQLAVENGLILIEDAACALGSQYDGRYIGAHGHDSCFSFHPRKLISTGEGGALITHDPEKLKRAKELLNHGASISDMKKHQAGTVEALLDESFDEMGYNYRMTNFQGAMGIAQMAKLKEILCLRSKWASRYREALNQIPSICFIEHEETGVSNWQSFAIRVLPESLDERNRVAQKLLDHQIACRPAYMACHEHKAHARYQNISLPNTELALKSLLILPLYPTMTENEFDYIVEHLKDFLM